MDVNELLGRAQDALAAKRVFGEPIQQGEVTVIPAARVAGGGGGGQGEGPQGQGTGFGSGFGVSAHPAGIFVVKQGRVRWRPALDINRIILGGQIVAATALLSFARIAVARLRALQTGRVRARIRPRRRRQLLRFLRA